LTTSAIFFFYSANYYFFDLAFVFDFLDENGKSPLKSSFEASLDGMRGSLETFFCDDLLIKVGVTSPKAAWLWMC
jgi:hypothetical protein